MRKIIAVLSLALAASACTSGPSDDHGGLFDRVVGGGHVHGDADTVTITGVDSVASALPLAIGHCSHFGKSAQYASRGGGDYVFRCVPH